MPAKKKKILITGGTGFLGAHIVRKFLDAGEKNLRVMASSVPEWMTDEGIEPAVGSVTDEKDVTAAVKDVSAIYHLAGKVSRDNEDAAVMNRVHVQGTRILCEAATKAKVKTIILASSSGTIAISERDEILDETFPPPMELISRFAYYSSKFYQEKTAVENFSGKGQKLVIINPSLLLGPGDERLSSTKPVLDFLARKIPYTPSGGLNFVDVRDTADAFVNSLDKGEHREKYLLGAENMTFEEFFGRLERLSGISAPMLRVPKSFSVPAANFVDSFFKSRKNASPIEAKEVEIAEMFWYFDSSKAEESLGFDPRDPQQTLNDTIKYLRKDFLGEGVFGAS
ncbi:MAG: NAD-dependent epimerase/dehydratase family protein [Acidobacteria bacterium]|nr:MAG: NAD-dependent epimerase/dehydratase family protein [Acidobacteriota bacterium]REK02226.1 MAG: NAD-dependent epimerase/dehydratase family protein [Acidobacteriota bacterium]REK13971.1 MAG: NAD-dependent epimerase/dehydratase family protein [Acidobacteriota bacterium]REK41966.1 MAG: NAD-dependent epimerase/dehydratase family protein [Acidobacteriota bacterium]